MLLTHLLLTHLLLTHLLLTHLLLPSEKPVFRRYQVLSLSVLLAALLSGCGDDELGTLYPVNGTVFLNSEPINVRTGYVMLVPDINMGNDTKFKPAGTIDADGSFKIYTSQRNGAPPGWYKVIVTGSGAAVSPTSGQSKTRPLSNHLVPEKYGQEKSTPLSIEVVASPHPDAYKLDVTK